ncbi:MAG: GNAT family N-acetyltransferase [Burkholderiales bacterium]|nr:GNAT family N-acetyltransferase [Burkholderiales bacterium]
MRSTAYTVRLADWQRDRDALALVRNAVFIVEQGVPANLEWDDVDRACVHALALDAEGRAVGCGRLLPDGHVGRMAVLAPWRSRGVGSALLQRLIEVAIARGDARVALNAQVQAMPFYERFGFAAVGAPFDEAGIPHQAMSRSLSSSR